MSSVWTGPVVAPLLDGLLLDSVPPSSLSVEAAVVAHRAHRRAWYGDLLGPIRVPASSIEAFIYALQPGDEMRVVLTADRDSAADDDPSPSNHPLELVRRARAQIIDNHRIELVGIELPLADFLVLDQDGVPLPGAVAEATQRALDWLDFSVPAWLTVEAVPTWLPAFDVLAQDAAENVGLVLPRPAWTPEPAAMASVLQSLVSRGLPFAVIGGVAGLVTTANAFGLLNVVCAVRGLTTGEPLAAVAATLTEPSIDPLAAAVRKLTEAEAVTVRDLLPSVALASAYDVVSELELAGLIEPDAA